MLHKTRAALVQNRTNFIQTNSRYVLCMDLSSAHKTLTLGAIFFRLVHHNRHRNHGKRNQGQQDYRDFYF